MDDDEDSPPIYLLPEDTLRQIFAFLPLRQIFVCRSLSKFFLHTLTSPSFLRLIPPLFPLRLLALRPPHHHHHHHHHRHHHHLLPSPSSPSLLHAFDPHDNLWLRFSLSFLPFRSLHPVASSLGVVYLWGDSADSPDSAKSLVACNPLTRRYSVLPQLGSAWSRHGSVLVDSANRVMVLSELAALYFAGSAGGSGSRSTRWLKFSSNLPSKPRSPVLASDAVYALCDIGSPWRSQWKLFSCSLRTLKSAHHWIKLEKNEWGDVFDILKRPRLVKGTENNILMVGGLKSSFALNASCSTILILKLDLETLEWEEAGRMPVEMFQWFAEPSKFKVFGGGNRVCFSGKRIGRLALWDCFDKKAEWRWIDGIPAPGDGFCRGFVFEAGLTELP